MRAAGFYPTKAEAAALLSHVHFLAGLQSDAPADVTAAAAAPTPPAEPGRAGIPGGSGGRGAAAPSLVAPAARAPPQADQASVDFGAFLALYVNHRPLVDTTQADLEAAFAALRAGLLQPVAGARGEAGAVDGRALLEALQLGADGIGAEELCHILKV
jgi:hypothetical protein